MKNISHLQRQLCSIAEYFFLDISLVDKLQYITEKTVECFGADFARIWLIREADLCNRGCIHAKGKKGDAHHCKNRHKCLHLVASSGRYTHTNGKVHRRVPFGAYKIGKVAAGLDKKFLTNDVQHDPKIHNHKWAKELGLRSFAGYRLCASETEVLGVFALFSKNSISPEEDSMLQTIANITSSAIKHDLMEKSLRESEESYRSLFEAANDGIIATDKYGIILEFNQRAEEIFGYTKDEVVGKPVWMLSPERYKDSQRAGYERVKELGATKFAGITISFEGLRKDGTEVPIELSYSSREKADGSLIVMGAARDVSERIVSEKKIAQAKEFLENIFRASGDAIMVTDSHGQITMANDAMANMLGYTKDELIGMHGEDFVPKDKDSHRRSSEIIETLFNKKDSAPFTAQDYWIRKNGEVFPVEMKLSLMRDEGGQVTGGVNIIRDITERKRLEDALQKSQEKYRSFINTVNDLIFESLPDGTFSFINTQCRSILGYEVHEIIGKNFSRFVHPDDAKRLASAIEQMQREKDRVVSMEYRARHKDGSWHVLLSSCVPLRDSDGNIESFMGVAKDLTEYIEAEQEIRLQKDRLNALLSTMPDGVTIINKQHEIEFMNQQLKQIFSSTPGQKCYEVFADRGHSCDVCPLVEILEKGKKGVEKTIRDKEGKWYDIIAVPISNQDGTISVLKIIRDITERKVLEQRLNQSQKMESIGTLAGGVAHDFNNILVGILGYASFIKTLINNDDKIYKYVDVIESSANQAAKLTQRLLAFSRQGTNESVSLDLNKIIKETLELFSKTIYRTIEIETHLSESTSSIMGDPTQLQQAILNICINARDAMPQGGKLILETRDFTIDSLFCKLHPGSRPGNYVCLSITDTGIGMDERTIKKIFEPFFTTKGIGKGTGLGLSMVYGTIKSHGGYVDVYSSPGKGTTFKIYLPVSSQKPSEEKDQTQKVLRGRETILLVDDEELIRQLGEDILKKLGYGVLLASDGVEAIEVFKEHKNEIDLVILDLIMPRMDGQHAYKKLKHVAPEVKVLISSGYSKVSQQNELVKENIKFIQKPFSIAELSNAIREVIGN